MFFSVEQQPNKKFTHHYKFNDLYINTDDGWTVDSNTLYKGYDQSYCKFVVDNTIRLEHPKYRTFPLYYNDKQLTNLFVGKTIAADKQVTINNDLTINTNTIELIEDVTTDTLSEHEVIDYIYNVIDSNVKTFLETNTLPVYVYLSGGIDTTLCFSFIEKYTKYNLVEQSNTSEFWDKNSQYIRSKYWAYNQIHFLKEPGVLVSGCPGDEYTMRGPAHSNLYLMYQHSNILNELEKVDHCLHKKYFMLDENQAIYKQQAADSMTNLLVKSKRHLYRHLINMNLNDFQHWHIDNTLTFCPLHDIRIFKAMLRLPYQSLIGQMLNADISRKLISRNNPGLLDNLDNDKNPTVSLRTQ